MGVFRSSQNPRNQTGLYETPLLALMRCPGVFDKGNPGVKPYSTYPPMNTCPVKGVVSDFVIVSSELAGVAHIKTRTASTVIMITDIVNLNRCISYLILFRTNNSLAHLSPRRGFTRNNDYLSFSVKLRTASASPDGQVRPPRQSLTSTFSSVVKFNA